MKKKLIKLIFTVFSAVMLFPSLGLPAEILDPKIEIHDNNILVSTGLIDLGEIEAAIRSGVEKDIMFTVELIRVWKLWPDEFVILKKIRTRVKYDYLRERFMLTFSDGKSKTSKMFKGINFMKSRAFMINNMEIANIHELEPGSYYLRVVAESKSRELPRVIGLLMLFIPEVEMSLAKESAPFTVGEKR